MPTTRPATRQDLFDRFARLGIEAVTCEHAAVFTVEESQHIKADLPGGHTKNLFLKDKKGALFLIAAEAETKIDLKGLHKHLGCGRLSFGSSELLSEILGVTPGSVTAFALINDRANKVRFIVDAALMAHTLVNFHPLENTATTAIAAADLLAFARACDHEPQIFDFEADLKPPA